MIYILLKDLVAVFLRLPGEGLERLSGAGKNHLEPGENLESFEVFHLRNFQDGKQLPFAEIPGDPISKFCVLLHLNQQSLQIHNAADFVDMGTAWERLAEWIWCDNIVAHDVRGGVLPQNCGLSGELDLHDKLSSHLRGLSRKQTLNLLDEVLMCLECFLGETGPQLGQQQMWFVAQTQWIAQRRMIAMCRRAGQVRQRTMHGPGCCDGLTILCLGRMGRQGGRAFHAH